MAAMSDGDRLRMAADRLDSRVFGIRRMAREVQWMPTEGCDEHETTAALLRAVADDIEDWRDRLEHWPEPITLGPPTRAWDAALALADTILAGSDE